VSAQLPHPVLGLVGRRTEYATYLALHPGATHTAIDDVIWPDRKTEDNLNTRNPATSKLRRWVGTDPDGNEYLPRHSAGGGYGFLPSVTTDVAQWDQLLAGAPLDAPTEHLALGSGRCSELDHAGVADDDEVGPGGGGLDVQPHVAPMPGQRGRDRKEPQPQPFRLPPPGRVLGCDRDQLGSGGQVGGEHDQGAPDPVLVEPVQGYVPQAGVLRDPDPVLTPGAAAVPQLEVSQLQERLESCQHRQLKKTIDIALT